MVIRIIGHKLRVIYPALTLVIALTAWCYSSLSPVCRIPSIGDDFNFIKKPLLSNQNLCAEEAVQNLNHPCLVAGGLSSNERLSTFQNKIENKFN